MASEVGHNKNVANFKSLYQILEEMGTMYNPSYPAITLTALEPIKTVLDEVVVTFNTKNPLYKNAVAQRETNMAPLSKLTTRIVNSFRASGASAPDIENADSMARVIRGHKRLAKVNPETASPETISTSRMSYDSRTANFDALISFLESQSVYAPNENDIKLPQLKQINLSQKQQNAAVNQAANELLTARVSRNNALYSETDGIIRLIPIIKNYLKSLGEQGKPYYKVAVRLKFRNN
jgi:hypothetical protein